MFLQLFASLALIATDSRSKRIKVTSFSDHSVLYTYTCARELSLAMEIADTIGSVYGFASGAIDVFGGLTDLLFPPADAASFNNFRVHIGETAKGDEQRSTGGNAPSLAVWDVAGRYVNQVTPDGATAQDIDDSKFRDYRIQGKQGVDYLSVVRTGTDGICIHLITGEESGTGRQFMWTGDMGKVCGAPWYLQVKPINNERQSYVPACVWIDGNGDSGHLYRGFNLHLSSFIGSNLDDNSTRSAMELEAKAWNEHRDLLCKSEPRFSMYEDIEIGNQIRTFKSLPSVELPDSEAYRKLVLGQDNWDWGEIPPPTELPTNLDRASSPKLPCPRSSTTCPPNGPSWNQNLPIQESTRRRRRRATEDEKLHYIKKRQAIHADRLIVSKFPQHSAVELCGSAYSLGPDMVSSIEGMFCDMSEKQLWPLCSGGTTTYCFDMQSQTVLGSVTTTVSTSKTPPYSNTTSDFVKPAVGVAATGNSAAVGQPAVPDKSYSSVETWDP